MDSANDWAIGSPGPEAGTSPDADAPLDTGYADAGDLPLVSPLDGPDVAARDAAADLADPGSDVTAPDVTAPDVTAMVST